MREAYIVSAVRTAVGSFGGTLKGVSAVELGTIAVREALKRSGVDPAAVDEVILGNVLQGGHGQNLARQCSVHAGIPHETPAITVNKVCGSGVKTVALAAQAIRAGDADVVVAGGAESMSTAPFLLKQARWGYRMGNSEVVDHMILDGLWDSFNNYHMGMTAENVAEKYGVTREDQDIFAAESQRRACEAVEGGLFDSQIVPVAIPQRKGDPLMFARDEYPRAGTTVETLSKLKPAFKKDGTVTAGNASGINDGAGALVVVSGEKLKELGLKPIARIASYASAGVDPAIMGIGPAPASRAALKRAGWSLDDVNVMELNEAFAAQAVAVVKELDIQNRMNDINIHGGAIAIGHPIGASGTRIFVTLLYAMMERKAAKGLAALCIGGGQGTAITVEMEN